MAVARTFMPSLWYPWIISIWRPTIELKTDMQLYLLSIILCSCETWTTTEVKWRRSLTASTSGESWGFSAVTMSVIWIQHDDGNSKPTRELYSSMVRGEYVQRNWKPQRERPKTTWNRVVEKDLTNSKFGLHTCSMEEGHGQKNVPPEQERSL